MTETSLHIQGFFPGFDPKDLGRLAGPLPTWALSTQCPWQQWGLAEAIVRGAPGDQVLLRAAAGLLSWAWQERPLDAPVLAMLLTLDSQLHFLAPDLRGLLQNLRKRLRPLAPNPAWQELAASGDNSAKARFLEQAAATPQGPAWISETWTDLVALDDRETALRILRAAALPRELEQRLALELLHHHGQDAPLPEGPSHHAPWLLHLEARRLLRDGDRPGAARILRALLDAMPWHANLLLAAHDAALLPSDGPLPEARTALLVYSWNKAELTAQTLESLFASRIGDNPVFVLDNGSTDDTPQTLRNLQDRYGHDRLTVVTLPVNVGAPGARNWLLSLPEVRACRYAAFLDDDVLLPEDWLSKLLHAAARHPECATVGCCIRDHAHPHKLQSADYHLLHRLPGDQGMEPGERLRVFNNCTGTLDPGLFGYERPCLSVSGCCHLLDLSTLDSVGLFDVRFNPTQFDDLDRDIRAFLSGKPCLYTGSLQIDHVQRSSMRQASSNAQVAHILGNKIKLEAKYDDKAIDGLVTANLQKVWNDLLAKQAALRQSA
ncbi:hypothetical protein NNJEOMEG_03905 [Fundidesulfovibrio magnetotacticus]|uniref:Glycosyltransferase 2-like domain-containing protein n=1 Tax=Fundidesulfovibrio magnetotacticus TaxID=2730080 RepID=A0A6V8LZR0_9BACT|nr:glycosyltransferase [Fundidesulfovibrio magnetotacticus]GFK96031.1 hypothetical protein NNJEOMEG_03905 [Fundidesulfovibrio magnetotacticus]